MFYANLELAERYNDVEGDIVECGVWRGGMIAAISEMNKRKQIHLFDSFEGLPEAKDIDGKGAIAWQQNKTSKWYYNNCSAPEDYAIQAMYKSGSREFYIHKGWFSETVPYYKRKISILRLDCDWYESVMCCMKYLFPLVTYGGVVIIDDYYVWDGCAKAIHEYLKDTSYRVSQYNNKVAYISK